MGENEWKKPRQKATRTSPRRAAASAADGREWARCPWIRRTARLTPLVHTAALRSQLRGLSKDVVMSEISGGRVGA